MNGILLGAFLAAMFAANAPTATEAVGATLWRHRWLFVVLGVVAVACWTAEPHE